MKTKIKNYVSIKKAAEMLGISIPAIFAANKRGTLKLYEIEYDTNVVKISDIEKYKRNRQTGRPPKKKKQN